MFTVKWLYIGVAVRPPLMLRDWLISWCGMGDGCRLPLLFALTGHGERLSPSNRGWESGMSTSIAVSNVRAGGLQP